MVSKLILLFAIISKLMLSFAFKTYAFILIKFKNFHLKILYFTFSLTIAEKTKITDF